MSWLALAGARPQAGELEALIQTAALQLDGCLPDHGLRATHEAPSQLELVGRRVVGRPGPLGELVGSSVALGPVVKPASGRRAIVARLVQRLLRELVGWVDVQVCREAPTAVVPDESRRCRLDRSSLVVDCGQPKAAGLQHPVEGRQTGQALAGLHPGNARCRAADALGEIPLAEVSQSPSTHDEPADRVRVTEIRVSSELAHAGSVARDADSPCSASPTALLTGAEQCRTGAFGADAGRVGDCPGLRHCSLWLSSAVVTTTARVALAEPPQPLARVRRRHGQRGGAEGRPGGGEQGSGGG